MKVRVRKWQIQSVIIDYGREAASFLNLLLSPSVEEQVKNHIETHRQFRLRTETNPAYQLPIIYIFNPEFNSVDFELDLSDALVLDEFD